MKPKKWVLVIIVLCLVYSGGLLTISLVTKAPPTTPILEKENKRLSDEIKRLSDEISDNLGIERHWHWTPEKIKDLPDKPGVYVLWKEARVIHIGMSSNLKQRLSQHEKKREMTSFDWYQTRTEEEAKRLEKNLHRMFRYKGK